MKHLKRFYLLLFLIALNFNVSAQLVRDLHRLYHPSYFFQHTADTNTFESWHRFTPGETRYSLEVGTGFSSFGGGNSFSTSFISPMVSFSPTERLQIVAGGKFSYANMNNIPFSRSFHDSSQEQGAIGNPTEAFAYGRYLVNSRLSIYGMGAFGTNQLYYSPFQSGFSTTDYQQISFGMDYKISEKTSIGASFGIYNGPAWGNSPMGGYRNQSMNPFFP